MLGPQVGLDVPREVTVERERWLRGAVLPPANGACDIEPDGVALVQFGEVTGPRGLRTVLLEPLHLRVPTSRARHRFCDLGDAVPNRRAVVTRPADEVPPLTQYEHHTFIGRSTCPFDSRVAAQAQPEPHARRECREVVVPVSHGVLVGLRLGVPGGDLLQRRDLLEQLRGGGARPQPADEVPAGVQHRRDRGGLRRLLGGGRRPRGRHARSQYQQGEGDEEYLSEVAHWNTWLPSAALARRARREYARRVWMVPSAARDWSGRQRVARLRAILDCT